MQTQMIMMRFVGSLRGLTGKSKTAIKLERSLSLREAVQKLCERTPELNRAFAETENRRLTTIMLILVNGKEISALEGLDTILKDGDEVVFVPIVHGG